MHAVYSTDYGHMMTRIKILYSPKPYSNSIVICSYIYLQCIALFIKWFEILFSKNLSIAPTWADWKIFTIFWITLLDEKKDCAPICNAIRPFVPEIIPSFFLGSPPLMLAMATNYFRDIFAESYFTMQNYPLFFLANFRLFSGFISRKLLVWARAYFRRPES